MQQLARPCPGDTPWQADGGRPHLAPFPFDRYARKSARASKLLWEYAALLRRPFGLIAHPNLVREA